MFKLKRKAFRMVGLLFPITLYAFGAYGVHVTIGILTLFIAIMFTLEDCRFRDPAVIRRLFRYFSGSNREKEGARVSATTLYLLSCWLVVLLFPKAVATAAMVFLAFGDPVAELVGTRFGRIPLLGKTLEGAAAGFLACLAAGGVMRLFPGFELDSRPLVFGALAATIMELIPAPVDDDFTVPLFSATVMNLARVLLA